VGARVGAPVALTPAGVGPSVVGPGVPTAVPPGHTHATLLRCAQPLLRRTPAAVNAAPLTHRDATVQPWQLRVSLPNQYPPAPTGSAASAPAFTRTIQSDHVSARPMPSCQMTRPSSPSPYGNVSFGYRRNANAAPVQLYGPDRARQKVSVWLRSPRSPRYSSPAPPSKSSVPADARAAIRNGTSMVPCALALSMILVPAALVCIKRLAWLLAPVDAPAALRDWADVVLAECDTVEQASAHVRDDGLMALLGGVRPGQAVRKRSASLEVLVDTVASHARGVTPVHAGADGRAMCRAFRPVAAGRAVRLLVRARRVKR